MLKIWSSDAWNDYMHWQEENRKLLKKINELIRDIERNGASSGVGKPEPLKGNLSGYYSRRIDSKNRIVYRIQENSLWIIQCGSHYRDK